MLLLLRYVRKLYIPLTLSGYFMYNQVEDYKISTFFPHIYSLFYGSQNIKLSRPNTTFNYRFYSPDEVCLLRGTNSIFNYNSD